MYCAVLGSAVVISRSSCRRASLNHPNIISVYDIGGESGIAYTISELVDGESLRQIISRGPLPVRRIIEICQQIAEGISAAHAAGIVHRDLKPENIMVRRDGRVKILDFGLAKRTINARCVGPTAPTITATTTPGMVIGTPTYMAPEQVRGESVDERSDIFSFGLIMYEMATGRAAFSKSSTVETMHAILTEEPPEISGSVPRTFASVLQRCLEKEPARRFQSAADLGFALTVLVLTAAHAIVPARSPLSRRNFIWTGTTVICTAAGTSVG
jgi:eukaryotic-like serine/threonine-protein kinase